MLNGVGMGDGVGTGVGVGIGVGVGVSGGGGGCVAAEITMTAGDATLGAANDCCAGFDTGRLHAAKSKAAVTAVKSMIVLRRSFIAKLYSGAGLLSKERMHKPRLAKPTKCDILCCRKTQSTKGTESFHDGIQVRYPTADRRT